MGANFIVYYQVDIEKVMGIIIPSYQSHQTTMSKVAITVIYYYLISNVCEQILLNAIKKIWRFYASQQTQIDLITISLKPASASQQYSAV